MFSKLDGVVKSGTCYYFLFLFPLFNKSILDRAWFITREALFKFDRKGKKVVYGIQVFFFEDFSGIGLYVQAVS
jgi:hypothetical protein